MASLTVEQLAALEQAAHWYTRLNDADATAHDREAWQAWLGAAPTHAWAWQQAERLQQRLHRLPGALAERTLGLAGEERRAKRRACSRAWRCCWAAARWAGVVTVRRSRGRGLPITAVQWASVCR
ncbi:DUF4880 domain-containing protein [Pseudomonas sp. MAFF212427]|uniref:DUF4880 domain-containing protein n=1 Tax=Pseudomonas brassicae TaxID=2708063 RepID=A0A6B3NRE4_9PSED|nr:DUF4880 domain-containing protein [Pseudomonas brassicae]NER65952.1 DUF4880 domain-containing protein [Pseudomonas brassicae]